MRTTQLKIGKEKREAVLVAGGPGFKIYTANGIEGWVVVSGRQVHLIEASRPEFDAIGRYVNLRYQAQAEHEKIKLAFDNLLKAEFSETSKEAPIESENSPDRPINI